MGAFQATQFIATEVGTELLSSTEQDSEAPTLRVMNMAAYKGTEYANYVEGLMRFYEMRMTIE
eukprot:scaffold6797_cov62-Cylindrotheca_fusiformis.AAC.2